MWPQLPEDPKDLKAVMVWIHGGGFMAGSGTSVLFGPDHLLTEDIVFVSINYRLGILGISNTNIYLCKTTVCMYICMHTLVYRVAHPKGRGSEITPTGHSVGVTEKRVHYSGVKTCLLMLNTGSIRNIYKQREAAPISNPYPSR
jgi:hypothetical protein